MAEIQTQNNKQTLINDYFKTIRKRDGRLMPFNQSFITRAIMKAMAATGEGNEEDAIRVSDQTFIALKKKYSQDYILGIEEIQDIAEESLILLDYAKTAKAYILYRQKMAEIRIEHKEVPERIKKLVEESKKYFRNSLGEFIYYRTYSRWIEEENRRETWIETISRYIAFMKENLGGKLTDIEYQEIKEAILNQKVMPSMRLLWGAGKAARKNNVCAYNCSYIAPAKINDFAEIMFLLMNGAGVGFSVEHQTTQLFPQIQKQIGKLLPTYVIEDSKEGWGDALTAGLTVWFEGKDINFDFSKIRPAGSHLKTMGGKASGPEPLKNLLEFSRRKILTRQGKRLRPIDVHDIICKIGEVVVMGGVRRSALISLSDLDDEMMKTAKMGQFYLTEPQRSLANNSVAYNEKPTADQFLEEWLNLIKSGAGERGIFNRGGLKKQMPERRWKILEKEAATVGTNPCGEIYLKSKEFCNLTEVVARSEDTEESLLEKIRIAAILGTYQSTFTNFSYLSEEWKKNCEEERLLGVSITGQWDCQILRNAKTFRKLKEKAIEINKIYAERFNINPSAAITCVKPSGTVSQLVDASSGMHPRHSRYYIRRVRIAASDSLFQMLKEQRISYYPEVGQSMDSASTYILEFPIKAPAGSIFRNNMSAIEQLEYWKLVKEDYTEHNPSVTISVGKDEWIKVGNWIYENWDIVGGLSFLPREDEDHVYKLAPYEEIDEKKYNEMVVAFPEIDFSQIIAYEGEDGTQGAKELACVSGVCEI